MGLISDNNPDMIEHILHPPCQVIWDDHNKHISSEYSFGLINKLNLMGLNVLIPSFDLVLPVEFERGGADNEQGPLMFVYIGNGQWLYGFTNTHFVSQ